MQADAERQLQVFDELGAVPGLPQRPWRVAFGDVERCLQTVAADTRIVNRLKRRKDEASAAAVLNHRIGPGMAHRNALASCAPGLAAQSPGIHGEGSLPGVQMMRWMCPTPQEVPRMLGLARANHDDQTHELFDLLLDKAKHDHDVIMDRDQERLPAEPRQSVKSKPSCLDAGICMCGPLGDKVWAVKQWLCNFIKRSFADNRGKRLLTEGYVVLCLRASACDGMPEGSDVLGMRGQLPDHGASFLHISFLCEKPFRPTFRVLIWPDQRVTRLGHLKLKGTDNYQTLFEFVAGLWVDLDVTERAQWAVRAYELCDGGRPVAVVDPRRVEVRLRLDAQQAQFFPRKRQPRDLGWADALMGLEGEESSGEEERSASEDAEASQSGEDSANASLPGFSESESGESLDSSAVGSAADGGDCPPDAVDAYIDEAMAEVQVAERSRSPSLSSSSSSSSSSGSNTSSSSEAAAPPVAPVQPAPVPAPVHDPIELAPRSRADVEARLPFGIFRVYNKSSTCVAHCNVHGQMCRLTRSVKSSIASGRAGQGRPLGLQTAWLQAAHLYESDELHKKWNVADWATRVEARTSLQEFDGTAALFAAERPPRAGEPDEPEVVP